MSGDGYAPLFASLTTGTLCGKWPDIGLWPIVLSLSNKNGVVDVTHQYISTVTGLPLSDVIACMQRFCEADYGSRSSAEAGARLMPLEDHRDWGWQVVNHAMYRERARLMAKSAREVESGMNRHRMSDRPPPTAGDRRPPPETAGDRLSDANANIHKTAPQPRRRGCRVPEPFPITEDMRAWAKVKCPHVANVDGATEEFVDYWRGVAGRAATKVDWEGTWRNRMRELETRASQKKPNANGVNEWR